MANVLWGNSQSNSYPNTPVLDEQTKMPTRAWQQYFLNILNFTSATAHTASKDLRTSNTYFCVFKKLGKLQQLYVIALRIKKETN